MGFVVPSHDRPVGLRLLPLDHQGLLLRYVLPLSSSSFFHPRFTCSREFRVDQEKPLPPDTGTFSSCYRTLFAAGQAGIEAAEAEASGANLLALPSTTATSSSSSATAAAAAGDSTKSLMQLKQEKDDEERKKRKAGEDAAGGGGAKKSRTEGKNDGAAAAAEKDFTGVTEKEMGESPPIFSTFLPSSFASRPLEPLRSRSGRGRYRLLSPSLPAPQPPCHCSCARSLPSRGVMRFVRSRHPQQAIRIHHHHHRPPSSWSNLSRWHRPRRHPVTRGAFRSRAYNVHLHDLSHILGWAFGLASGLKNEATRFATAAKEHVADPSSRFTPFPSRDTTRHYLQRNTDGVENNALTTRWRISAATNSFRCKKKHLPPSSAIVLCFGPYFSRSTRMYCTVFLITVRSLSCTCRNFRPAPSPCLITAERRQSCLIHSQLEIDLILGLKACSAARARSHRCKREYLCTSYECRASNKHLVLLVRSRSK